MKNTHFRKANPFDSESLAALKLTNWRSYYGEIIATSDLDRISMDDFENEWAAAIEDSATNCVYVATHDGEILGFAHAVMGGATLVPELMSLHVSAHHQGRGVGRQLLHYVAAEFTAEDYTKMNVLVLRENTDARRFYSKLGGKELDEQTWKRREFRRKYDAIRYSLGLCQLVLPN